MIPPRQEIMVVFDGECPVCRHYCQAIRPNKDGGKLIMVNARKKSDVMTEITAYGIDIDRGIVVKTGKQLYYGSAAISVLARISDRSGFFNRLNYRIFKSEKRAKLLYPVLVLVRNILLKIRGSEKINNLTE
ncbi:MAG: DUF393 domain-containing protein [Pseudomonadales bacterium]|nr:DUF393 domain-containing protein [Pseudomonadales bacterium]